jgi:serine/threonine kinase PknH
MGDFQLDEALNAIEGYAIDALVGRGGMGVVYRARQLSLGQPVAIKVLSESLRADSGFVARFGMEARLQANLQHPHVVPVLDGGECDGVPFLVMRYIDGFSLRELMRSVALAPVQVVELLTGVASALDFAHARGVLHLDVKPQNVLVEGERHAWLADFGLTRLVGDSSGLVPVGGLLGSFDYLAPEIARGDLPSPASDVYSLAVTAFHALTGALPFPVPHQAAAVLAHATAPRPRASACGTFVPLALDAVLQRGMAIEPAARQPTPGALVDELRAGLGLARLAAPPSPRVMIPGLEAPGLRVPSDTEPTFASTRQGEAVVA